MKYPSHADLSPKDLRRLMTRHRVTDTGCWEWLRAKTTTGYGHFSIDHIYYQAHRLMYVLMVGPFDEALTLDHLCRNRACVNPDHLEPVTHAVNVRRGAGARVSPEIVIAIRAEAAHGKGVRQIARERGINHSTVSRIVNRLTWGDSAA